MGRRTDHAAYITTSETGNAVLDNELGTLRRVEYGLSLD